MFPEDQNSANDGRQTRDLIAEYLELVDRCIARRQSKDETPGKEDSDSGKSG